jgi:hypothetical protein
MKWISIKNSIPAQGNSILVTNGKYIAIVQINSNLSRKRIKQLPAFIKLGEHWTFVDNKGALSIDGLCLANVTHWMSLDELPELPKNKTITPQCVK